MGSLGASSHDSCEILRLDASAPLTSLNDTGNGNEDSKVLYACEEEISWGENVVGQLEELGENISGNTFADFQAISSDLAQILSPLEEDEACTFENQTLSLSIATALCEMLYSQFENNCRQELQYIDLVIRCETRAVTLSPKGDEKVPLFLKNLGRSHLDRFQRLGNLDDVDKAIELSSRAILLTPKVHEALPGRLGLLGSSHLLRFGRTGKLEDINRAIECHSQAVQLTPRGHTDLPDRLSNLGNSHQSRFDRIGDIEDIHKAIELQDRALLVTPEGDPRVPRLSNNLGSSYLALFERLGQLDDLDKAMQYLSRAMAHVHKERSLIPSLLLNLGISHSNRFNRLGRLEDIDRAVYCCTEAVSLAPEGHPSIPSRLQSLGNAHLSRFERLGNLEDIEKAIEYQSRAVTIAPEGHASIPIWLDSLGNSHRGRFRRLDTLEDIHKAIDYQAQAVSIVSEDHGNKPIFLNNLGSSYTIRFDRLGNLDDIDKAIECQTQMLSLTPEGHADMPGRLSNLGSSHLSRFEQLGELRDIDKAIECQGQAILLVDAGHANLPGWLHSLGYSQRRRFERLERLEDVNRAIEYHARALTLTPKGHVNTPGYLASFGNSYQARFKHSREPGDINMAIEHHTNAVALTPKGHADMSYWLNNLGISYRNRFKILNRREDIDNAIGCHTEAIALVAEGHANTPNLLNSLGNSFKSRFKRLGNSDDIKRAIENHARAVRLTPEGHAHTPNRLNNLGASYYHLFKCTSDSKTLGQSLECWRNSAQCSTGYPFFRYKAAYKWAQAASLHAASERINAYQAALDLLPELIWLGSTIGQRYDDVRRIGDLSVKAVATAIDAHMHDLALEWLEQSRSIIWNQKLQLRTPLDDLSSAHPSLAGQLRQAAAELHRAASSTPALIPPSHHGPSLEQAAQRHRRLAEKYDNLVKQVRSIAGFEGFLKHKKASELVLAAQSGPVIVVNIDTSRCDALILRPGKREITHIPLPSLSHAKVVHANAQMERSLHRQNVRERGDPRRPRRVAKPGEKDEFIIVLTGLWKDAVEPVLDSLGYLRQPENNALPHVTWCTTGPLSFLPIHAAGCYDQQGAKAFELVVSSYTPTLSALLPSDPFSPNKFVGILAVGQEATPGQSRLPETVAELACIRKHVQAPLEYTQLNGDNATTTAVLASMEQQSWVHLACHAHQNVGNPTESGFFLHDGVLDLATITQSSFENKGLAFLSACQTATGDKNIANEAVHLASGMLFAGYPSVIATMWSIMDEDAPLIADRVYGELLKDGQMAIEGVAEALHGAVGRLRDKVGETAFTRWVPYIHLGR